MFAELKRYIKTKKQLKDKKDMAREATFKNTTYLRVGADGNFYTGSKEPKEGYTEYTSSKGNVSYRKSFSGTEFGKMTQLGIEEKVFDTGKVKYLTFSVENEDAKDIIQLPLKTQGGGLTDEVKKFIAILPGIDFSKDLTVSSNKKRNERGYVDRVLFINYVTDGKVDEQGLKFSLKFGENGDIPMFTKKQGIDGVIYDFVEQDTYLYNKLIEQLERFNKEKVRVGTSTPNESVVTEEATPETVKDTSVKEKASKADTKNTEPKTEVDEDDDLPF